MTDNKHLTSILKQTYQRAASSVDAPALYVDLLRRKQKRQLTTHLLVGSLTAVVLMTSVAVVSETSKSASEIASQTPTSSGPEVDLGDERLQLAKDVTAAKPIGFSIGERTRCTHDATALADSACIKMMLTPQDRQGLTRLDEDVIKHSVPNVPPTGAVKRRIGIYDAFEVEPDHDGFVVIYIELPGNSEVRYLAMVGHGITSQLLEDMVESMTISDTPEK